MNLVGGTCSGVWTAGVCDRQVMCRLISIRLAEGVTPVRGTTDRTQPPAQH